MLVFPFQMVKTRRITDLNEWDEENSSSSHRVRFVSHAMSSCHSRSTNSTTSNHRNCSTKNAVSDGRQEEQSGPNENKLDRMERILEGILTHVTRNEPPRHTTHVLDQYCRQRPSVFKGKTEDDPCMIEFWMEQTEKLLQHLQCSDEEKLFQHLS